MAGKKHKNAEDRPVPFLSGIVKGDFIADAPNGTVKVTTGAPKNSVHIGGGFDAWEREDGQGWRTEGNSSGE